MINDLKFVFITLVILIISCNNSQEDYSEDSKFIYNCADTIITTGFLIDFSSDFVHIIPTKFIYLPDLKGCFRSDNFGIGFQLFYTNFREISANNESQLNFQEFIHKDLNIKIDRKIKIAPVKIKFIETPTKWRYQNGGIREKYQCFTFDFNISEIRNETIITIMDTRPVKVLEIEPFK